jgi:hypothetical protein
MGISYSILYEIKYWNNGWKTRLESFGYNTSLPITKDQMEHIKLVSFEDFKKRFDPTNDLNLEYKSHMIDILAFSRFGGIK